MMHGSCHCGAVTFEVEGRPDWLTDCNCSICRRLGSLWFYPKADGYRLAMADGATRTYSWGDKELAFHTCATCGCTTHWSSLSEKHPDRVGLNGRLLETAERDTIPVRCFDGAETWEYLD